MGSVWNCWISNEPKIATIVTFIFFIIIIAGKRVISVDTRMEYRGELTVEIFFVYGKGSKGISTGEKELIFFFFNKGRNGRAVWKPDVIRYSVVIAFDTSVSVPFAKGEKERHFRRFGKKYDLPEASIVKSFKTITQKFHFIYLVHHHFSREKSNSKLFYNIF